MGISISVLVALAARLGALASSPEFPQVELNLTVCLPLGPFFGTDGGSAYVHHASPELVTISPGGTFEHSMGDAAGAASSRVWRTDPVAAASHVPEGAAYYPWIELPLPANTELVGIRTQGDPDADNWVTSYEVWLKQTYEAAHFDATPDIVGVLPSQHEPLPALAGNSDRATVVDRAFTLPVHHDGSFSRVRIVPRTWHGAQIAMRVALLLKNLEPLTPFAQPQPIQDPQRVGARYSGVGRLSAKLSCTATYMDAVAARGAALDPAAPAYALTAGHCLQDFFVGSDPFDLWAGKTSVPSHWRLHFRVRSDTWTEDVGGDAATPPSGFNVEVPIARILYSTLQGWDIALLELGKTNGEMAALSIQPIKLWPFLPENGAPIQALGVPVGTGSDPALFEVDCQHEGTVDIAEFSAYWSEVVRTNCPGIRAGFSGGPLVQLNRAHGRAQPLNAAWPDDAMLLFGVMGTATHASTSETCYANDPCELVPDAAAATPDVLRDDTRLCKEKAYGAQAVLFDGCFDTISAGEGHYNSSLATCTGLKVRPPALPSFFGVPDPSAAECPGSAIIPRVRFTSRPVQPANMESSIGRVWNVAVEHAPPFSDAALGDELVLGNQLAQCFNFSELTHLRWKTGPAASTRCEVDTVDDPYGAWGVLDNATHQPLRALPVPDVEGLHRLCVLGRWTRRESSTPSAELSVEDMVDVVVEQAPEDATHVVTFIDHTPPRRIPELLTPYEGGVTGRIELPELSIDAYLVGSSNEFFAEGCPAEDAGAVFFGEPTAAQPWRTFLRQTPQYARGSRFRVPVCMRFEDRVRHKRVGRFYLVDDTAGGTFDPTATSSTTTTTTTAPSSTTNTTTSSTTEESDAGNSTSTTSSDSPTSASHASRSDLPSPALGGGQVAAILVLLLGSVSWSPGAAQYPALHSL